MRILKLLGSSKLCTKTTPFCAAHLKPPTAYLLRAVARSVARAKRINKVLIADQRKVRLQRCSEYGSSRSSPFDGASECIAHPTRDRYEKTDFPQVQQTLAFDDTSESESLGYDLIEIMNLAVRNRRCDCLMNL
jgi:hypothetical protein